MIQKRTTEPSKNSVHAPWIHAAGILTALWLMIVFLITAVEAVAYWTPGYYKMEYEKYQVLDDLPEMTMDDLLSVTDEMMAYLRGNREDLHVFTTMGGEYREFFNAREIAHMEDVRGLFLGGLWLRRIGLMFTLAFAALLYFWKRGRKDRSAYLALAAVISTDFSRYFVVFHHIFFDNDLWILDPDTDMLINIVPEAFFMDTALRIAIVFATFVTIFFGACLFLWLKGRKAAEKGGN